MSFIILVLEKKSLKSGNGRKRNQHIEALNKTSYTWSNFHCRVFVTMFTLYIGNCVDHHPTSTRGNGRIGGEHGHQPHETFVNVLPTHYPPRTIHLSEGFALNSTTMEPDFGLGERWRGSFPVGGHVRLQYGKTVHCCSNINMRLYYTLVIWETLPLHCNFLR